MSEKNRYIIFNFYFHRDCQECYIQSFDDYDENLATPASVQVYEEDDCKI